MIKNTFGNTPEQPEFKQLTLGQTLARFGKYQHSPSYAIFTHHLERMMNDSTVPLKTYPKNKNLPLLLQHLLKEKDEAPLVDKESKVVFVPYDHDKLRTILYVLKSGLPFKDSVFFEEPNVWLLADKYTAEGMGYFWSSMNRSGYPIAGESYRSDKIDRDAWLMIAGPDEAP
jgi:hypothetical protein